MIDHLKRLDWDFLHTGFVGVVGIGATNWDTGIARSIAFFSLIYIVTKVVLLFNKALRGKSTKDEEL